MDGDDRRTRARRVIGIGGATVIASIALLMLPLLLGPKLGRFVAAPALLGVCAGASIMLHGALDRWRG